MSLAPKNEKKTQNFLKALTRFANEDPSFRWVFDREMEEYIMTGMGELHLDIIVDRMKREFKVEANVGAPQVAYRETFTKTTDVDYTHKKQSGGSGQFARVKMTITPMEPGPTPISSTRW